jgi:Mg2+ and Co2+ transporter CorA
LPRPEPCGPRGARPSGARPDLDVGVGGAFAGLVDRLEQTLEVVRSAREMVLGSVNLLIARTGQRTNDVMKVLTLASIMLLPSSLLAGVLGMNFQQGFFDNAAGFWVAVAAMAVLAVATLVTARLRRWI